MKDKLTLLWYNIQIAVLKPCVWIEDKINKYDEWRLKTYMEWEFKHRQFSETLEKIKKESK